MLLSSVPAQGNCVWLGTLMATEQTTDTPSLKLSYVTGQSRVGISGAACETDQHADTLELSRAGTRQCLADTCDHDLCARRNSLSSPGRATRDSDRRGRS